MPAPGSSEKLKDNANRRESKIHCVVNLRWWWRIDSKFCWFGNIFTPPIFIVSRGELDKRSLGLWSGGLGGFQLHRRDTERDPRLSVQDACPRNKCSSLWWQHNHQDRRRQPRDDDNFKTD